MHLRAILILLLLGTLGCAQAATFHADMTTGQSSFDYVLKPPKDQLLHVEAVIDPAYLEIPDQEPAIDILLLIDNTGSMGNIIEMIKNQIDDISAFLLATYPNARIAVASIAEHASVPGHDAFRVVQSFTADPVVLRRNIATLQIDHQKNGDFEEPYLYGLSRALAMGWRDDSQKILFFIGDAWARDPDEGADKKAGTADDLEQSALLQQYADEQIQICSYYVDQNRKATRFFTALSETTNGFLKPIRSDSSVKNDFETVVTSMVGLNIVINPPYAPHTTMTQTANRFAFDADLSAIDLWRDPRFNVQFSYNNAPVGRVGVRLVPGKPWGILVLSGAVLFLLLSAVTLRFIYRNIYMTTVMDYAYLRHYGVLLVGMAVYALIFYGFWTMIDAPRFPIIWHGFWW